MSIFVWNINFFIFWRIAWIKKDWEAPNLGWKNIGRFYWCKQPLVPGTLAYLIKGEK